MAIITISRGTFSGGRQLAECVAHKLGYRCLSREVLVDAAVFYNVPFDRLNRALAERPGLLERMSLEKVHYLSFIRATLIKEVKNENTVYHGLGGHLLLKRVPHVLRVKVIANMEYRIKAAMERNRLGRKEAIDYITRVDAERVLWTKFLYHAKWNDPRLYDLVINLDHVSLSGACEVLCQIANHEEFKPTHESQQRITDMILSADIRAAIASCGTIGDGGIEIEAHKGTVVIGGTVSTLDDADKVRVLVRKHPGVKEIDSRMSISRLLD